MPTVKDYKNFIRANKPAGCRPYSNLKKNELMTLAIELGWSGTPPTTKPPPLPTTKPKPVVKKPVIKKAEVKAAPKPVVKAAPKPVIKKEPVKATFKLVKKPVVKKAEVKAAPKPEVKAAPIPVIKPDTKNTLVYKAMNEFLNSKSKQAANQLRKKDILTTEEVNTLVNAQRNMDFYPTPDKCLSVFDKYLKKSKNLLEATAGTGSVVNYIKNINPKVKVDANEFNPDLLPIIKKYSGADTVMNKDFFNIKDFSKYDTIFINPPFSKGTNKKYYFEFLFYTLSIMSKNNNTERLLFISPELVRRKGGILDLTDIIKEANINVFNNTLAKLGITPLNKKQFKEYLDGDLENDDLEDAFGNYQIQKIGTCKGFGGTNIEAGMYEIKQY